MPSPTHGAPVSEGEILRLWVERDVAVGAFGVMVGAFEACGSGVEATAGEHCGRPCGLGGAEGGTGYHLFSVSCSNGDGHESFDTP